MLLPLSVLLLSWLEIDREIWSHLWDTQLPRLLGNTLTLVLGVGIGVTLLGVSLAWLTSLCEFPGRRWLDWALMLPFAIPALRPGVRLRRPAGFRRTGAEPAA